MTNQPLKDLIVVERLNFSASELDQGFLKLGSLGCGVLDAVGELGSVCFSLDSSASKLRSFSSSNPISLSSCFVRSLDSAILLSTTYWRRQTRNWFGGSCGYNRYNCQRGNAEEDAHFLPKLDSAWAKIDGIMGTESRPGHRSRVEASTIESSLTHLQRPRSLSHVGCDHLGVQGL